MVLCCIFLSNKHHCTCRVAVYKVLYRLFGGYVSDVVAAIEQVCIKQTKDFHSFLLIVWNHDSNNNFNLL